MVWSKTAKGEGMRALAPGCPPEIWCGDLPVQPQLCQFRAQRSQVPNLQAAHVHAEGELATVRAESQREHSGWQDQQRLQGARLVQPSRAQILGEPRGTGIRGVEDAAEVRQCVRLLPGQCAPEF